jgi:hypothetical protein
MKSDVQALVNEVKSMTDAINIIREEGPRGGEVAIQAFSGIQCDMKEKVCECCKDMVIE